MIGENGVGRILQGITFGEKAQAVRCGLCWSNSLVSCPSLN